jgi:hypothetical protein
MSKAPFCTSKDTPTVTQMHTETHTRRDTKRDAPIHTHSCTQGLINTDTVTYRQAHSHTHAETSRHRQTDMHRQVDTHTQTQSHTHSSFKMPYIVLP